MSNDSPEKIARGFAIGVFWGVFPTFGFAILLSLPIAVLLKANRLAAILGTFISNPFTEPLFILWGTYIGNLILKTTSLSFSSKMLNLRNLLQISQALFLGILILASSTAICTYGLLLIIIPLIRKTTRYRKSLS